MKIVLNIVCACALVGLLAACETTGSATSANARKQSLLMASGFKQYTVTTPQQQALVAPLPVDKVSAVKYKGKLVYVFPTEKKDQILAGRQRQYNAYKKALAAQRTQTVAPATGSAHASASAPASQTTTVQTQQQQQAAGYADMTEETAGPNHVQVQVFDGFGPMPGTDESY